MRRTRGSFPTWVALGVGLALVIFGLWAFFSPRSFFDSVATWRPFNKHFLHDIGAFQLGIGATLLLAAKRNDALFVALAGAGIGLAVHFISHLMDQDLGGKSTDPILFGVLAAVVLAAAYQRYRSPVGRGL